MARHGAASGRRPPPDPQLALPRRPEETLLFQVVRANLESLLARADAEGRPVPRFVERELRAFLRCGVAAHGFLIVRCRSCGHDRLLPFSCKGRGFCPSCGGRRMADTAAHLVDRVFPEVPVRQWVLSLPQPLRFCLGYDRKLCTDVLAVFLRVLLGWHERRAREILGVETVRGGAVTVIQRFGSSVNPI